MTMGTLFGIGLIVLAAVSVGILVWAVVLALTV